jgi:hypothetical protein
VSERDRDNCLVVEDPDILSGTPVIRVACVLVSWSFAQGEIDITRLTVNSPMRRRSGRSWAITPAYLHELGRAKLQFIPGD